jgi:amino acid adenylation domain-containing protein
MTTPVTRSQELFWTGQALAGEVPLYNQAWRFDFKGSLDPDLFAAALEKLVERADILRTVFRETKEGVFQDVHDVAPKPLERVDLSSMAAPEAKADLFIEQRSKKPFDLRNASYDAALLQLSDQHWVLYFNQHHIVTDAWSVSILFDALRDHLEALQSRRPMPKEKLPSFLDFAAEENRFRSSTAGHQAADHWRTIANASSGPVRLYGRRNAHADPAAVRVVHLLSEAQIKGLTRLSQMDGISSLSPHLTQFNIFITAFLAYVSKVSGQRHVTIGTPAHNRTTLALRRVPGLFVEVFPFAAELETSETFRSLFGKVASANLENMRFSQAGAVSAESGRAFNVILNYINVAFPEIDGLSRHVEWLPTGAMDPSHDMRLHVMDMNGDGKPVLAFDLNSSTFPESVRNTIPEHFAATLDAMLEDFDQPIDRVAIATDAERTAYVEIFNDVAPADGAGETMLSLVEQSVSRSPDAVAVRFGVEELTFEDLDRWSDAIAFDLAAKGCERGAVVAVHMTRSLAFVASVLGVMKAGAAFLPLDSHLPLQRLHFLVEDADVAVVLTESSLAQRLDSQSRKILVIDGRSSSAATAAVAPIGADDTAYVIYTSGSTGVPKGVAVGHGALASYLSWARTVYASGKAVSMPFFTAIGFDLTLTSLFVPLISGGSVVVYPEPVAGSDLSVLDVFNEDKVDLVKLTPAHLALVLEQASSLRRLKALVLGGEDLKTSLARSALDNLGKHISIFNEYGPTEAVVGCMVHRFDPGIDRELSVPIGVPADGVRIYLLDEGMNPVPAGVTGEIWIGGDRLAKGYVGRQDLTAERFIDDPFLLGERLYRTGDLARFNNRNQLEYLGRADRQVKLRGVRIELGEVEQAILSLPGIGDAVVVPKTVAHDRYAASEVHCINCGLSSAYPDAVIDETMVCSICRELEGYRDRANVYFSDLAELRAVLADARIRSRGDYDCIVLTSGGKDSIYALARLVEIGPRILALTLDNGYLSDGAKDNISRVTKTLGVDHRYVSTPAMNAIFVDSLKRHSNVCNGCFKTIYTLAMQTALSVGAPVIVTGLSRGQFFETRLTPDLFKSGSMTCSAIEAMVVEARKAYHRTDDAVSKYLDVEEIRDDAAFDQIQFVDFYRYCDASLDDIYRYLHARLPWQRPDDTGRSSNCLINDVGIYVHKRKEGFHNYALPYSWDVRMGHKDRNAALDELNDDIDIARVRRILNDIGYDGEDLFETSTDTQLIAYVVSNRDVTVSEMRTALKDRLPPEMIPMKLLRLDSIPLTVNGKVDQSALPDPDAASHQSATLYRAPTSEREIVLAAIWADVLRIERVGIDDNFYDIGGDSIAAIRIAARARKEEIQIAPTLIFQHQTVAELAAVAISDEGKMPEQFGEEDLAPFALADLGAEGLDAIAQALGSSSKTKTQ